MPCRAELLEEGRECALAHPLHVFGRVPRDVRIDAGRARQVELGQAEAAGQAGDARQVGAAVEVVADQIQAALPRESQGGAMADLHEPAHGVSLVK